MSLQNKMFFCIVIFLIIPFLILGFLYYGILIDVTKDNLDDSSYELLEQMERNILSKTDRLKSKTDVLLSDRRLQELLRDADFSARDTDAYDAFAELDDIMEQYFYDESELESIFIFPESGGIYRYKGYLADEDRVSFLAKYGTTDNQSGSLTWFGVMPEFLNQTATEASVVAKLSLRDTNYYKDQKQLAGIYFVCGENFFDSVRSQSINPEESFMIYTPEGNRIYAHGGGRVPALWEISLHISREVYENQRGSLRFSLDGEDCILVFYTCPVLGWKYVRIVQYTKYFAEAEHLKYLTLGIALFLFLALCGINSLWLRRLTRPVKEIVSAMHEVGKRNFDVSIIPRSKDEFAVIANGFNNMVKEIRELFHQVILEEQKSKEAELAALQYQINPHFLYNTLSAIRLKAIFNKQPDIAEMLSLLGNFLHNTLSSVNKQVLLEDELQNLKAYISLYQIRFSNRIVADFSVEEGLEQCRLHSMLIQPVVENAIMHGLNEKLDSNETAVITIRAKSVEERLIIRIRDNGMGMTKEQCEQVLSGVGQKQNRLHIGLSNIHKRIKYLYGSEYGVTIESELGEYSEITLTLPLVINGSDFSET